MRSFDEKDLLTRELHERSADVGGHPVGFDEVRRSAGRIRRRRQVVAGAVAAMAVGVVVPAGLSVTSGRDAVDGPVEQPSVITSPTPGGDDGPEPRPGGALPLTLGGLPRGEQPGVPYVLNDERTLVTPDGRFDLPEAYSVIVPYRGGWLALGSRGEDGYENVVLDADLNVVSSTPGGSTTPGGEAMVRNADGTRVLYARRDAGDPERTVVVDAATGDESPQGSFSWSAPPGSSVFPVGYAGGGEVVYEVVGEPNAAFLGRAYGDSVPLRGFLKVLSVSESAGLVAGRISYDSAGRSCYGVMEPAVSTSEMVWETCDHSLFEFSPDGTLVVAGPPDYDMWGPSGLTVLDLATGEPVVELDPPQGVVGQVSQATWEDADTVLAVVVENDRMGMVRVELDGHLEAATDVLPTTDMTLRLWFAERPRL